MNMVNQVQISDKVVDISYSANTLGKGRNPIILLLVIGKIVVQTRLFCLGMVTILEKGKLWIQTCLAHSPMAREIGVQSQVESYQRLKNGTWHLFD